MRYVIPDIHGCNKTLKKLLKKINLQKEDKIIFLGDYIDRGPDSYGVLQTVSNLQCETILLKGNHEEMAINYFNQPTSPGSDDIWRINGGEETLKSVPFSEWNNWLYWMKNLKYYHKEPDYFFVHASFDWIDPFTNTDAMLWERFPSRDMGKPVVCGHTPTPYTKIKKILKSACRNIYLDNGCFVTWKKGYGKLLALNLDTKELKYENNIDIKMEKP